jgi:hypothetical protein
MGLLIAMSSAVRLSAPWQSIGVCEPTYAVRSYPCVAALPAKKISSNWQSSWASGAAAFGGPLHHCTFSIRGLCARQPRIEGPGMRTTGMELVPILVKESSIGHNMINAPAETVAENTTLRKGFTHRRCLVLADGFYEWRRKGWSKQPYYIHFADYRPFACAGL